MPLSAEVVRVVDLGVPSSIADKGMRVWDAWRLWRARQANPLLHRELPLPYNGYRDPLHAYARLGAMAAKVSDSFKPYLITIPGSFDADVAAGIATIEIRKPQPNYVKAKEAVELSYWHGITDTADSRRLGTVVVDELIDQVDLHFPEAEVAWMVTLPSDQDKQRVLSVNGFNQYGSAQRFDIADEVTEARLLWTRQLQ